MKRRSLSRILGFSLIELLVSLAIIAVLAAILVPVVGSVREAAISSKCVSHQHQIGVGILGYISIKGGLIPGKVGSDTRELYTWSGLPSNVIGQAIDAGFLAEPQRKFIPVPSENDARGIYACPSLELSSRYIAGGNQSTYMTDTRSNSMKVVDGQLVPSDPDQKNSLIYDIENPSRRAVVVCSHADAHGGHPNILFLDGHVERMKTSTLEQAQTGSSYWNWGKLDANSGNP